MIRLLFALLVWAGAAQAEARVDPARSTIEDAWWSLRVELGLSAVVPYRVYTLDAPHRLVLDFQGVDLSALRPDLLLEPGRASAVRFGPLAEGWSRMVVDLTEPLRVKEAGMFSSAEGADLTIVLEGTTAEEFTAAAGPPPGVAIPVPLRAPLPDTSGAFVVVIDPGHGGIDPGADQGGVREAYIMMDMAQELAQALADVPGVVPVLTREDDSFIPLNARITLARAAGANLFISLHADSLDADEAQGASVYTLSQGGGDAATTRMVERHERGDLLSGVDLSGTTDQVAGVLMDMVRSETGPAARDFAETLVDTMREAGVPLNSRPMREGQLMVLSAPDFPAVLVEAGFLSNGADRSRLATVEGRAPLVAALTDAVRLWAERHPG